MRNRSPGASKHHPQGASASVGAPTFGDLGLHPQLLDALDARGYQRPTPIQAQAIPALLEGRDVLGIAQTGTGKTAAFALPILDRLLREPQRLVARRPRVLVLTPTRELASQVRDSFAAYGAMSRLRVEVIFGGVGQGPQVQSLRRGVDVLVATPGRLLDLMGQRHVELAAIELFVLDEA
ncbi:MAG: DEAD/DEAH box helicase, partial [Planctomycetes bacterium]|nr:DEAD/DEAH box helicase [Planctomycetota bacterium]